MSVVRSDHGIVRRQAPLCSILIGSEAVSGHQVATQRPKMSTILEAHQVVGMNRFSHRDGGALPSRRSVDQIWRHRLCVSDCGQNGHGVRLQARPSQIADKGAPHLPHQVREVLRLDRAITRSQIGYNNIYGHLCRLARVYLFTHEDESPPILTLCLSKSSTLAQHRENSPMNSVCRTYNSHRWKILYQTVAYLIDSIFRSDGI